MTEQSKVVRPEPEPYVGDQTGERDKDFIVATIGGAKKCLNRYEITIPVPNVSLMASVEDLDKACQLKGISLQDAINAAHRQIFGYRPPFDLGFDKEAEPTQTSDGDNAPFIDYPLKAEGHAGLQKIADEYVPGRVTTSVVKIAKKKAADFDNLEALAKSKGFASLEELIKSTKKAK